MKYLGLMILLAVSTAAFGQSHGEGGGGVVYCKGKKAELYDYLEAREPPYKLVTLRHPKGDDFMAMTRSMIKRMFWASPYRQALYGRWLDSWETERQFLPNFPPRKVPDSERVSLPLHCRYVQAVIQQYPELPDQFRYYVNQKAWDDLDEENRAGLVFHELLYREAMTYGHDTSVFLRNLHRKMRDWAYGVNRSEAGSRGDFLALLMESHFPVSDIESFGSIRRIGVRDVSYPVAKNFEVEDALLVQFGRCLNDNCTEFKQELSYSQFASLDTTVTKDWWPLSNRMDRLIFDRATAEKTRTLRLDPNRSYSIRTDFDWRGSSSIIAPAILRGDPAGTELLGPVDKAEVLFHWESGK